MTELRHTFYQLEIKKSLPMKRKHCYVLSKKTKKKLQILQKFHKNDETSTFVSLQLTLQRAKLGKILTPMIRLFGRTAEHFVKCPDRFCYNQLVASLSICLERWRVEQTVCCIMSSAVLFSEPRSHTVVVAMPYLCWAERKRSTAVRRRLSRSEEVA